jgi:hypothetical protein
MEVSDQHHALPPPPGKNAVIPRIGGWVDPRADLEVLETRKRSLTEVNSLPSWKCISAPRAMPAVIAGEIILAFRESLRNFLIWRFWSDVIL